MNLTDREKEIEELVYKGLTKPEIAKKLYIEKSTVSSHIAHLCDKKGARGTRGLMAMEIQKLRNKIRSQNV